MSDSKIEWTQQTWNPIVGCSLVSPGCTNCYAMRMAARLEAMRVGQWRKVIAPGTPIPSGGTYEGLTQPSKAGSGGESGPGARPSHPDWHRKTRDWCAVHSIAYFFKQWGEWRPYTPEDDFTCNDPTGEYGHPGSTARHVASRAIHDGLRPSDIMLRIGKKRAGRLLDGVEHSALPPRNTPLNHHPERN